MGDDSLSKKIEAFFGQYRELSYQKGQILLLSGDQLHDIYYLTSGKVKQYDVTYRGDEVILNVFKPFAFFPMSIAINKTKIKYIFEAETDIKVRRAPVNKTLAFIKENPDVMFDLLARVYHGTDGLMRRMAYLMASSAKSRLIYELLIEAKRFGEMRKDGSCSIKITEKDLGARAGLSRETVSREAAKLKQDGLIKITSKDILISNVSALEQKLGQEI